MLFSSSRMPMTKNKTQVFRFWHLKPAIPSCHPAARKRGGGQKIFFFPIFFFYINSRLNIFFPFHLFFFFFFFFCSFVLKKNYKKQPFFAKFNFGQLTSPRVHYIYILHISEWYH